MHFQGLESHFRRGQQRKLCNVLLQQVTTDNFEPATDRSECDSFDTFPIKMAHMQTLFQKDKLPKFKRVTENGIIVN